MFPLPYITTPIIPHQMQKPLWDLTSSKEKSREICGICVSIAPILVGSVWATRPHPKLPWDLTSSKEKIPWDPWDLCEAEPINRGICVSQDSLNQYIAWQKHIQAIGMLWFHFCKKGNVNLLSFHKWKCFRNWSEPIIKTWSIFAISPLTFPYQVPQKYYSYPFLCQQTSLISNLYKYFSQR